MGAESPFADLRRLADWFGTSPTRPSLHVERIVDRLGALAVPLLGRELASADLHRRDAARAGLARLATRSPAARARVIGELRTLVNQHEPADGCKVTALGLLAELGERGTAKFADPTAIQRSSALALAAQIESAADVAAAADLMIQKLADADLLQLVGIMADAAPSTGQRVAAELCVRLDVALELRERIAELAFTRAPAPDTTAPAPRAMRPTHVTVLADSDASTVVVCIRKVAGERRWRRWAVLIEHGRVDDCVHDERAATEVDAIALIANLKADGYRVTGTDAQYGAALVAAAARASGQSDPKSLPAAYYLGRDLLDLGDVHSGRRANTAALGRALELLADGDIARARALLARCDVAEPDVAAAVAACLLAERRPADAIPLLSHAAAFEPGWPMHHWNLAAAYHATGDAAACHAALRRFVATSGEPSALIGDPDQPGRVALASRLMAELERHAKLVGARTRRARRISRRHAPRSATQATLF